jgi:hypothetical protein
VSNWFFMLGEALAANERRDVKAYLHDLDLEMELPVVNVHDWEEARRVISDPHWDRRWWDAEQRERRRLQAKALAQIGEDELRGSLSQTVEHTSEAMHGAAAVEAARGGCTDAGLIKAAAGAAAEALYLSELARLAGEDERHAFRLKQSLFAGGHWLLGIVNGQYHVF